MFLISDGFKKGKKAQKSDEKGKNRRKLKIFALLCTTNLIIYYIGAEKREQKAILSADCSRFHIIIRVADALRSHLTQLHHKKESLVSAWRQDDSIKLRHRCFLRNYFDTYSIISSPVRNIGAPCGIVDCFMISEIFTGDDSCISSSST